MKITSTSTSLENHAGNRSKLIFLLLTFLSTLFYSTIIFGATVYVDPTNNAASQNGSIDNPYNSWRLVTWRNGDTYLQKRGTTANISGSIGITGRNNMTIGAYGTGARPRITQTSGSGHVLSMRTVSNCVVRDLEISSTVNGTSGIIMDSYGTDISANNLIDNCEIHGTQWGVRIISKGAGNKILNSTIHTTADDGVYINGVSDIEIGYCNIYNVNTYYFVNKDQSFSAGDNIQLVSNNDMVFHIHHNILDHSSTGNKFCFISAGETYSGVIEYNTMTGNSANVTSCIYLGNTNKTVTIRYNTLKDGNYAVYSYVSNLQFHYNQVIRNNQGLSIMNNKSLTALNNVFYNNRQSCISSISNTSVTSKNNIFHLSGTGARVYGCNSSVVSDHNNFNTQQNGFLNGQSTLASWQSSSGNDAHSFVNNPSFVNIANDDFRVQSNSPCINTGTNVGLNQDFFGTPVPQSGIPDIGFYEHAGNQGSNAAPVINDQTFTASQGATNGTLVGTVVASDPNQGQALAYTITSGNTNGAFALNQSNGRVTIANASAVTGNPFNLIVRVTDNGTPALWSQATITINITASPNQAPVINNQSFSVSQNAVNGTLAGTVVASDPDQGQTLTYTITSGNTNGAFALDQNNGRLTVANASAITGNAFNLIVRATDNGTPALWSQATISINITTSSNLAPVINNQSFTTSLTAANGTLLGTVVASDPNPGQTLAYTITSGNTNGAFALNQSNGRLTIANASAITGTSFSLIVRATDNGTPALWSQATITILVTGGGSQAPIIADQSFTVEPYAPNGTNIGIVVATVNPGQTIRYRIAGGNPEGAFYILSSNGMLRVSKSASVRPGVHQVVVRVTDNSNYTLWSEATMTVTAGGNTTNNSPVINNQSFVIEANPSSGDQVGTVLATDPDAGQSISYTVRAGNTNSAFNIGTSNGLITVNNPAAAIPGVFDLTIRATDNGSPAMWAEATVAITVNAAIPPEPPLIQAQSFTIDENSAVGTLAGKVAASCAEGQGFNYSIQSGNTGNAFSIDPITGHLTVNNSSALDFETNPVFQLLVKVTTTCAYGLYTEANVTVNLNNVNEAPVINPVSFGIRAFAPNGSFLGVAKAVDPDAGQSVTYRIVSGNISNAFHINYHNGTMNVTNSAALNPSTNPVFYLTVRVTDNGSPSLSSTAVIRVDVRNLKDGEINPDQASIEMPEPVFKLFPNPSNDGRFNLTLENMNEPAIIQVFDLSGKLITQIQDVSTEQIAVNLEAMPIGMYMIKITTSSHTKTIKAIRN